MNVIGPEVVCALRTTKGECHLRNDRLALIRVSAAIAFTQGRSSPRAVRFSYSAKFPSPTRSLRSIRGCQFLLVVAMRKIRPLDSFGRNATSLFVVEWATRGSVAALQ